MTLKLAINGFGRIGRLCLRRALQNSDVQVCAVNDVVPSDNLAYLFKYDTVHGRYQGEVRAEPGALFIDGARIAVYGCKDPAELPWAELGCDYVIESCGLFVSRELANKHLQAGAKRVLITAPAKGDVATFVMGVNEQKFDPARDTIVSNASCTTNCLAPVCRVLLEQFGIEEGLMTTVHALTASQPSVDGPSKKDWRGGRSASQNIIPSSTGAAQAVALCIPELRGKLTGMAFRVPVQDVSCIDLTVRLSTSTTYEAIFAAMKQAQGSYLQGILGVVDEEVVSSDFIGDLRSAIVDQKAGIALNPKFYKIVAWYDNEMAYSQRVIDLAKYMGKRDGII